MTSPPPAQGMAEEAEEVTRGKEVEMKEAEEGEESEWEDDHSEKEPNSHHEGAPIHASVGQAIKRAISWTVLRLPPLLFAGRANVCFCFVFCALSPGGQCCCLGKPQGRGAGRRGALCPPRGLPTDAQVLLPIHHYRDQLVPSQNGDHRPLPARVPPHQIPRGH